MLGIFSSRKEERYFGFPGAYRLHDDLFTGLGKDERMALGDVFEFSRSD